MIEPNTTYKDKRTGRIFKTIYYYVRLFDRGDYFVCWNDNNKRVEIPYDLAEEFFKKIN